MIDPLDLSGKCALGKLHYVDDSVSDRPAWADGIQALYNGVTQEPLPLEFQTLLNELAKVPDNKAKK